MKLSTVCTAFGAILLMLPGFGGAAAEARLPTGHDPDSEYSIRYDDLNLILKASVMDVGPSDRRPAGRAGLRGTSSRQKHGNLSPTAHEGNRIMFHVYEDQHMEALLAIRKDLEAVSDYTPLESFERMEQLAYWFNLHNVAVMYEVAKAYPVKKLKSLTDGRNSVWDNKTMTIAGVPVSIRDIEHHVVSNWDHPLVLYGFFMGTIGGPNIRDEAYTGDNVVEALQQNAVRFVNSLRGFRVWSGKGRVSDHYELGKHLFPNFEEDLKAHMIQYARPDTRADLERVKSLGIKNYDWAIADVNSGSVYKGSTFNTNPGALAWFIEMPNSQIGVPGEPPPPPTITAVDGLGVDAAILAPVSAKISPQTKALLRAVQIRNDRRGRKGTVTVEEFIGGEGGRITTIESEPPNEPDESSEEDSGGGVVIAR